MASLTKAHPEVANLIGEHRFIGKEVTMLAIDTVFGEPSSAAVVTT